MHPGTHTDTVTHTQHKHTYLERRPWCVDGQAVSHCVHHACDVVAVLMRRQQQLQLTQQLPAGVLHITRTMPEAGDGCTQAGVDLAQRECGRGADRVWQQTDGDGVVS